MAHLNLVNRMLMAYRLFGYDQGVMGGLLDLPSFVGKPQSSTATVNLIDEDKDKNIPRD